MELWLTVNGKRTCASAPLDPLTRAVVISLFTWRRAEPDDNADVPMGWWGDTWPAVQNDRYGSRLWLLQRSKLTNQLVQTVSNCLEHDIYNENLWYESLHSSFFRIIAFRMVNSLRMQATRATFLTFPAVMSRV